MHLIQILLPLRDNAGHRFAPSLFDDVREELVRRFGGVTAFLRAPAHGAFANDGQVQHDDIAVIEVMTDALDRPWWADYRRRLERAFAQDEIVIRASLIERL